VEPGAGAHSGYINRKDGFFIMKRQYSFTAHTRTKGEIVCYVQNFSEDLDCEIPFYLIEVTSILQLLYHNFRALYFHYIYKGEDGVDSEYYVECSYVTDSILDFHIYDFISRHRVPYEVDNLSAYCQEFFLKKYPDGTPMYHLPIVAEFWYDDAWRKIKASLGPNGFCWYCVPVDSFLHLREEEPEYESMFDYIGNLLDLYLPSLDRHHDHDWRLSGLI